jgi:rubrerythrin
MDMSLIAGAVSSLNAAINISKTALDARDAAKAQAALLEVHEALTQALQRVATMSIQLATVAQELTEAREEQKRLRAAMEERDNYVLVELSKGNLAYEYRPVAQGIDERRRHAPHYVCQRCFDSGAKVVLGLRTHDDMPPTQRCPACKREIAVQ